MTEVDERSEIAVFLSKLKRRLSEVVIDFIKRGSIERTDTAKANVRSVCRTCGLVCWNLSRKFLFSFSTPCFSAALALNTIVQFRYCSYSETNIPFQPRESFVKTSEYSFS